jgi:SAM-dependent methyltransferase
MSLSVAYQNQLAWRDWDAAFALLPLRQSETVLDLGCGVGDQAFALARRGAHVVGIDGNEALLTAARAKTMQNVEFRHGDLSLPLNVETPVDGLWCSFVAAYFPDLPTAITRWSKALKPGGWIAVVEVDDLFGHEPLDAEPASLLASYAHEALAANRYDFFMGRKLGVHLANAGFSVTREACVPDQELAFQGSANVAVLDAWQQRFDRMALLRTHCGEAFEVVRAELLSCLARPDHTSRTKVHVVVATHSGRVG